MTRCMAGRSCPASSVAAIELRRVTQSPASCSAAKRVAHARPARPDFRASMKVDHIGAAQRRLVVKVEQMRRHRARQMREGRQMIQRRRDLGRAAKAVAHHAVGPVAGWRRGRARRGRFPRARLRARGRIGAGRVQMIKRGRRRRQAGHARRQSRPHARRSRRPAAGRFPPGPAHGQSRRRRAPAPRAPRGRARARPVGTDRPVASLPARPRPPPPGLRRCNPPAPRPCPGRKARVSGRRPAARVVPDRGCPRPPRRAPPAPRPRPRTAARGPETRRGTGPRRASVTSMRGRPSSASGITSNPDTRSDPVIPDAAPAPPDAAPWQIPRPPCASWPSPRDRPPARAASRRDPAGGGAAVPRPASRPAHGQRATARRADRRNKGCARSAAHPPARDRATPTARPPPAARPAPPAARRVPRPAAAGAEDMQPVAKLAFLDVADETVDPGDRLGREAAIRAGQDRPRPRAPAPRRGSRAISRSRRAGSSPSAVEYSSSSRSSRLQRLGQRAERQRRRQMAKRHRADAPLGLRRLARIVDDEGIDHRQRTGQRLGPAVGRQRHRLARQPFQRAMRADMDQRMQSLRPQPEVEGDIAVARGAREVVIVVIARRDLAAFGLQRDQRSRRAGARAKRKAPS